MRPRAASAWVVRAAVAVALAVVLIIALSHGHSSPNSTNAASTIPAPTGVTVAPGHSSATVSWTAPAYSGGAATTFVVTATPGGHSCTTSGRSCTITGLTNGDRYVFGVVAESGTKVSRTVTTPAIVLGSAGGGSGGGSPTSHPTLLVQPSTGLANGQTVTVSGTGFRPNDHVYIVECLASATSQSGCALSTATPASITSGGDLPPTSFQVMTGTIGTGSCGTSAATASACALSAGNARGTDTAQARITFQ